VSEQAEAEDLVEETAEQSQEQDAVEELLDGVEQPEADAVSDAGKLNRQTRVKKRIPGPRHWRNSWKRSLLIQQQPLPRAEGRATHRPRWIRWKTMLVPVMARRLIWILFWIFQSPLPWR